MKITIRQAGGFVGHLPGLPAISLETDGLPAPQRARIERLVQDAGIIGSSPAATRGYPGAERLITVDVGGASHTARFPEGAFPEAVRELIEAVEAGGQA